MFEGRGWGAAYSGTPGALSPVWSSSSAVGFAVRAADRARGPDSRAAPASRSPGSLRGASARVVAAPDEARRAHRAGLGVEPLRDRRHPVTQLRVGHKAVDRRRQLPRLELVGREADAEPKLVDPLGVVDLVP